MSSKKILILILLLVVFSLPSYSQSRQVRKKIAKAEKVEVKQKKAEEKERKENIKKHISIQTKKTQARMKDTEKKAAKFNKRTDQTLINRIFNKRQRKARKKYG